MSEPLGPAGWHCTICGRERGISHGERHHTFAWRRRHVLQRREAFRVMAGAMRALDEAGSPVSDTARLTFERMTRRRP